MPYESRGPSNKEAESLAYCVCMMSPGFVHRDFARSIRTVVDMLQQSLGPWHHLVASLTSVWLECAEQELSERPNMLGTSLRGLLITGHKEDILHVIANIGEFSAEE